MTFCYPSAFDDVIEISAKNEITSVYISLTKSKFLYSVKHDFVPWENSKKFWYLLTDHQIP